MLNQMVIAFAIKLPLQARSNPPPQWGRHPRAWPLSSPHEAAERDS
jgi:hypothetical protein